MSLLSKDKALQAWFENAVHDYEIHIIDGAASDPIQTDRFLPAYQATAVPKKPVLPYLTYTPVFGAFEDGANELPLTVNLWFHTPSDAVPNAAAQELSERIGRGPTTIPCVGGYIWLKRGSPFSQPVDCEVPCLKCRYINIILEYLTAN